MNELDIPLVDGEILPIFPLPGYVLFPWVMAPLHIFEPRYRQMLETVLDTKGIFCIATLRETSRARYGSSPDIWGLGCACRLIEYEKLADGCYNIMVEGLAKVRLKEVSSQRLFRRARIERIDNPPEDIIAPDKDKHLRALLHRLLGAATELPPGVPREIESLPLPMLLNVMAFHCPVPVEEKLKLFYATSDNQLCDRLIKLYATVQF